MLNVPYNKVMISIVCWMLLYETFRKNLANNRTMDEWEWNREEETNVKNNKLTKKEEVIIKSRSLPVTRIVTGYQDRYPFLWLWKNEKHIDFQFEECDTKAENEYYRLSRAVDYTYTSSLKSKVFNSSTLVRIAIAWLIIIDNCEPRWFVIDDCWMQFKNWKPWNGRSLARLIVVLEPTFEFWSQMIIER